MKSDGTLACTMCQHCGQSSNWTHDDGSCPRCGKQRTPPIAQPAAAAHVERRAVEVGQRRKSHDRTYTVYAIEDRCAFVCQDGDADLIDGYVHNGGCCWESVSVLEDCELLTDAPPEPVCAKCRAVACVCDVLGTSPPAQEAPTFRDVLCSGGCGLRICLVSPLTWTCPTCVRKRTEAPKAVPVCIAMGGLRERCATGLTPVARMDGGSKPIMVCDGHWLMREQSIEVSMGFDAAKQATGLTGDPAIGERISRPQLAADWFEDCLPTVWR